MINGVGDHKLARFGVPFMESIKAFCAQHVDLAANLKPPNPPERQHLLPSTAAATAPPVSVLGQSMRLSMDLFEQGLRLQDIVAERCKAKVCCVLQRLFVVVVVVVTCVVGN